MLYPKCRDLSALSQKEKKEEQEGKKSQFN
jgi:hypothetical protein